MDSYDYYKWKEINKEEIYNINSSFFLLSLKYLNKNYKELLYSFNKEFNQSILFKFFKISNNKITILENKEYKNYFNKLFDISYHFSSSHYLKNHANFFIEEKNKFNKTGIITEEMFNYFKDFLQFYIKDINEIAENNSILNLKNKIDHF